MSYPDLMVDFETLGVHNDNRMVVVSLGAVAFNIEEVEDYDDIAENRKLHLFFNMEAQVRRGRHIDPHTVLWWLDQSHAAQGALVNGQRHACRSVEGALGDFQQFTSRHSGVNLWGNGSDFDCKALQTLYDDFDMPCPTAWHKNRCMRTLKHLYREIFNVDAPPSVRTGDGVAHDALSDAIKQALLCQRMYQEIRHGTQT